VSSLSAEPPGTGPRFQSVDAAATADEELVRALYAEHAGALLGYVVRLVGGDRAKAEDIVQETLVRAWRHPQALAASDGSPRAWLWTVARHLVVDSHRARQARPAEVGGAALEALASVPAADDLERAVLAWEVSSALATLSSDHRLVLLETYYRGRSVAEAAQVLGIPPGTVKSRTYYALRALRLALDERGIGR